MAHTPLLGELDLHLLAQGRHWNLADCLGAHFCEHEGRQGVRFAVWAPNASRVSVVGDFNGWDTGRDIMYLRRECGVWECFVSDVAAGARYKYAVFDAGGHLLPLKADPVARCTEAPPATASVVCENAPFSWTDGEWMHERKSRQAHDAPLSIYEAHFGSWRRPSDGAQPQWDTTGAELIRYVADMGYTHIELLPVTEHPFGGSWGYQPLGLFAPTARHGTPTQFAAFVDACHAARLGVILDWVPAHFPTDAHGLARFDGTALYEHADPRQGFHPDWNTAIYNFGRKEVVSFLVNNALYWLEKFHIDGLRVDAVASMLYLDYSRQQGEWVPNKFGGNQNLEAVEFLRRVNTEAYRLHPGTFMIAEESTSWPGVSKPVDAGGLGFGFKWNMGFMNDTLRFMSREPVHRKFHHNDMTFGTVYAFSENFVLPLSHDEVVHGKGSLLEKMPGDDWQKFANLRAYFGSMWGQPGKKLLFMGQEFAQREEWSESGALDWWLLDAPAHEGVRRLISDLNTVYRELPALHERDCEPEGFEWVIGNDHANSVLAWLRKAPGGDPILVVSNFTPMPRSGYKIPMPMAGKWVERINTDAGWYAGSNTGNQGVVEAYAVEGRHWPAEVEIYLPPLSTLFLKLDQA